MHLLIGFLCRLDDSSWTDKTEHMKEACHRAGYCGLNINCPSQRLPCWRLCTQVMALLPDDRGSTTLLFGSRWLGHVFDMWSMSSLVDAPPPASPGQQGGHTLPSPITISFYHDVLTCHRPGVKWPFEVPETVSQNEPFLFLVVFFRYFVTVL